MEVSEDQQFGLSDHEVIQVDNLEFRYGRNPAVNHLSFSLVRGQILGLIGKNGAGKTTTIHLLLGLLRYKRGRVRVLGLDPKKDNIRILDRCGFFPEQGQPYEWMRVSNLFKMGQYSYSRWDNSLCSQLTRQLELDPRKRISDLSKGMLVKTKLIFAMAHRPELLLLDEPTNGLDPLSRYDILNIIKSLSNRQETAVLISSHNLSEVADTATQICIINKGKDLLAASMDAVKSKFALLECAPGVVLPDQVRNRVIKSRKNRDLEQYLVTDKSDPDLIAFLGRCEYGRAVLKNADLQELFVFMTRETG